MVLPAELMGGDDFIIEGDIDALCREIESGVSALGWLIRRHKEDEALKEWDRLALTSSDPPARPPVEAC